jgi:hypothetical protein
MLLLFQKNFVSTASIIRGMSGESLSVMDCKYYIHKGILCPRSNDGYQISGKVLGLHIAIIIHTYIGI